MICGPSFPLPLSCAPCKSAPLQYSQYETLSTLIETATPVPVDWLRQRLCVNHGCLSSPAIFRTSKILVSGEAYCIDQLTILASVKRTILRPRRLKVSPSVG